MIALAGGFVIIIGFIIIARYLGLVEKSLRVIALSKQALSALRDPGLSDDDKEIAMRAYAKALGSLFIILTVGAAMAALIPVGVIWLLDTAGLLSLEAVLDALLSPALILGGTIMMIIGSQIGAKKCDGL
ncbi:MAG: hypothetical protein ACREWG_12270 [Gammaproteobacteria bacterium]